MNLYDILFANKINGGGGGGGSSVIVKPITIKENGTYTATSGEAFSPVKVNVPQPKGTIEIWNNGNEIDVEQYKYADVFVNPLPLENSYFTPKITYTTTASEHQSITASIFQSSIQHVDIRNAKYSMYRSTWTSKKDSISSSGLCGKMSYLMFTVMSNRRVENYILNVNVIFTSDSTPVDPSLYEKYRIDDNTVLLFVGTNFPANPSPDGTVYTPVTFQVVYEHK